MKKRKTYNQPKKVVGKTSEQKRNQIYAYILAFAMIFWTIASVLGVIGFVKSFVKADECSDDTVQAVSTRTMSFDISTPAVVNDEEEEEEFSDEGQFAFPLGVAGATCQYQGNREYWFAGSDFYVCIPYSSTALYLKGYDDSYTELDDEWSLSTCLYNRVYMLSSQNEFSYSFFDDEVQVSYENIDGIRMGSFYPYSCDVYCSIEEFLADTDEDSYVAYKYQYVINWYDYEEGIWFGTSELYLTFYDGYSINSSYLLQYPSLGYYNASAVADTSYRIGSFDLRGYTSSDYDNAYDEGWDAGYVNGEQNGYESGYDEGYDVGVRSGNQVAYDEGYNVGRQDGYNVGQQDGYSVGRQDGYNVGQQDGYMQGVKEVNKYSFNGLFSSIFDVPVKTFTSLFSFDILGVDLSGLFFSILTVGIILAVVKWLIP